MAIKNILLAYNASSSTETALRAALLMQKKYDAHLTGLLAQGKSHLDEEVKGWMPKAMRRTLMDMQSSASQKIESAFFDAVKGAENLEKLHWIAERGAANPTVAEYARMYDITVVGQYDAMLGTEHLELHPQKIALKSGRPVLVIPKCWEGTQINDRAILAWDGKRTATRALADAMSILETKQQITVLTVNSGKLGQPLKGIDVVTAIARHNVSVDAVKIERQGRSVAAAIIDFAQQQDAGLIVTGAYEHSAFREDLIGGVTNELAKHTPIPLLLSH